MNLCFNFFRSPISVTRLFLPVLERLFFEMTYNGFIELLISGFLILIIDPTVQLHPPHLNSHGGLRLCPGEGLVDRSLGAPAD